MQVKQTYKIPENNFSGLKEKIAKLNKRAVKLGCREIIVSVEGEQVEKFWDNPLAKEAGDPGKYVKFLQVAITGETPQVEGFEFIATIQHTSEGNIVRTLPEVVADHKYRTIDPFCDHCNTLRKRNDTFLLRNKEGLTKQIGRNCLQDYLGGVNINSLATRFELFLEIQALAESFGSPGNREASYFSLLEFVAYSAAAVRQYGFMSKGKADPENGKIATASITLTTMFPSKDAKTEEQRNPYNITLTLEDTKTAEAAITWAAGLKAQNPDNDYLWNLTVVAQNEYITYRETGLAASMVSAYLRVLEESNVKTARGVSEYVGVVKARMDFGVCEFDRLFSFEGAYGTTYILRFYNANGSLLIWKTGSRGNWISGGKYNIKGTVKAHKEYKGVKQTEITRVVENG